MKTNTHYLYGFIIVSLVVALVITSVSKPTPTTIEITPPVERTTEMVTLPPSDTGDETDDNTDDSTEKIYHDKYYTVAIYLFYFSMLIMLLSYEAYTILDKNIDEGEFKRKSFIIPFRVTLISLLMYTVSFIFAAISLLSPLDTLYGYQKTLMILLMLLIPILVIAGNMFYDIAQKYRYADEKQKSEIRQQQLDNVTKNHGKYIDGVYFHNDVSI